MGTRERVVDEDEIGIRGVAQLTASEAPHRHKRHPRGQAPPVGDDGPLGDRQRADERGVCDIGEGPHHVLLLDETEDVTRGDPEELTTAERAQRPHR